jgi:hypothetical protein
MLTAGYYKSACVPKWQELEDAAQLARSEKRNETRWAKRERETLMSDPEDRSTKRR